MVGCSHDADNDGCLDIVASRVYVSQRLDPKFKGSADSPHRAEVAVMLRNVCGEKPGATFEPVIGAFSTINAPEVFASHNPVAFDANGDGCDDIFISGNFPQLFMNVGCASHDVKFKAREVKNIEGTFVWAAASADFNNDSVEDLFLGFASGRAALWSEPSGYIDDLLDLRKCHPCETTRDEVSWL